MLYFTNTLTGKKEGLDTEETVLMYVCGITPYDSPHIGHGRCYVTFDVIYRLLRSLGKKVIYCRNFTDIDDKLLNRAEKEFGDRLRYLEIADRYIKEFEEDLFSLNCLPATVEPRVTDNIPEIINFIQQLINTGHAYQSGNDVYFEVSTFPDYGKLSKQKIEDLRAGVRIDIREEKKNPLDFALWKGESEGPFWESPWGYGRPGWHIECSVLACKYLGKHLDIHGGGLDLIFPHHENEIAQSESLCGSPFARMWIHNGFVNVNKEKMSKSLGNFLALHDVCEKYDPMVLRYYYLTHHYRAPIEFSFELLENAHKSYERIIRLCADTNENYSSDALGMARTNHHFISDAPFAQHMLDQLYDDCNTPGMLGVLFENITKIAQNMHELQAVKYIFTHILGFTLAPLPEKKIIITAEIQALIDQRNQARHEKNWILADALRDQLQLLGVDVHDEKI